jgi:toxin ParE1/3/4
LAHQVNWTATAWRELESAADFIALDSPRYAAALVDEAKSAARSLQRFPFRGRIVPEFGAASVREIFLKQYRLIYEIHSREVIILAFVHGARERPFTD